MDAVETFRRSVGACLVGLLGFVSLLCALVPPARGAEDVVVLTTDFATGAITTLPVAGSCAPTLDRAAICGDPVARSWNDRIYVVNRFGCDNIQVLDPFAGYATLSECSVGSELNPQDIAVVHHHRAYVTRYESNDLLEIDPESCAVTDAISLAGFADVDGLVEMHRMFLKGDRLYVQLQRLDRRGFPYVAEGSMLAVIDVTTNTLIDVDSSLPGVQAIELSGDNPIAPMQLELTTGFLLVPETGLYGVMNDGGIERVDLRRNRSAGFALPGAALNADLVDFAQGPGASGYVVIADASFNTSLMRYDSLAGTLTGALYAPGGYVLSDVLAHGGKLFVADRDFFEPGIRVWDLGTEAPLCGGVLPSGLPPFELLVRPDVPSEAPRQAIGSPERSPAWVVSHRIRPAGSRC
ncbi:MAG: hypothetical protein IPK72_17335 [Candidatus Eisenbacteria bacterium]|nr:hypothetical protein [Candidatus Eisenbacteria bacterium]